jgi:hypothetical protein
MITLKIHNLPAPNDAILAYIKDNVTYGDNQIYYRNKVSTDVYNNEINMAMSGQVSLFDMLDIVREQYQQYFDLLIVNSWFDYLINVEPEKGPAKLPPHTHTIRTLGLNYFIDLGGEDVRTCFYTHKPKSGIQKYEPQAKWGGYLSFDDVEKYGHVVTEKNKWHAYNTRIPHGVEGITGTRIFFTIVFQPHVEIAHFLLEKKLHYQIVPFTRPRIFSLPD